MTYDPFLNKKLSFGVMGVLGVSARGPCCLQFRAPPQSQKEGLARGGSSKAGLGARRGPRWAPAESGALPGFPPIRGTVQCGGPQPRGDQAGLASGPFATSFSAPGMPPAPLCSGFLACCAGVSLAGKAQGPAEGERGRWAGSAPEGPGHGAPGTGGERLTQTPGRVWPGRL